MTELQEQSKDLTPVEDPELYMKRRRTMGCMTAFLEGIFLMMEFLFGATIFNAVCKGMLSPVLSAVFHESICTIIYMSLGGCSIMVWSLMRFTKSLHIPMSTIVARVLGNPLTRGRCVVSSLTKQVMLAQIAGLVIMVYLQHLCGFWIFTTEHLYVNGNLNIMQVVETVILAPIREEIIFRVILASLFYRRVGSKDPEGKLTSIVVSSVFFSLVHAVNFMNPDMNFFYVLLQIVFAFLIGVLYSCEMAVGSVFNCFLMHILNNIVGSLVNPATFNAHIYHPLILVSFLESFLLYVVFCYLAVKQVYDHGKKKWIVVDGCFEEPAKKIKRKIVKKNKDQSEDSVVLADHNGNEDDDDDDEEEEEIKKNK